jgi:hypothetical protein
MNPSSQSEEAIFEAARQCASPDQRAAYLGQACAGRPDLRRRVEELLAAHDQAGIFLAGPAASPQPTIKLTLPDEEALGTQRLRGNLAKLLLNEFRRQSSL